MNKNKQKYGNLTGTSTEHIFLLHPLVSTHIGYIYIYIYIYILLLPSLIYSLYIPLLAHKSNLYLRKKPAQTPASALPNKLMALGGHLQSKERLG